MVTVGPIILRRINPLFHTVINTTLGIRKNPGGASREEDEYEVVSLLDLNLVIIPELTSMNEAKHEVRKLIFNAIEDAIQELSR